MATKKTTKEAKQVSAAKMTKAQIVKAMAEKLKADSKLIPARLDLLRHGIDGRLMTNIFRLLSAFP